MLRGAMGQRARILGTTKPVGRHGPRVAQPEPSRATEIVTALLRLLLLLVFVGAAIAVGIFLAGQLIARALSAYGGG